MTKHLLGIVAYSIFFFSCTSQESKKENFLQIVSINNPSHPGAEEPSLFTSKSGDIFFTWIVKDGENSQLFYSVYKDQVWDDAKKIASGDNWFVNWADFPSLVAKENGGLSTFYLAKNGEGTYAYGVNMMFSQNDGLSWEGPIIPHETETETEHGFVSLLPWKDGYFVTWLDGRNTKIQEIENNDHSHHEGYGAMSLRGAFLDSEGQPMEEFELDDRTCDCCQTTATLTEEGILIAYRDRSNEEVRDISFVNYNGKSWTDPYTPNPDNWQIAGCPVNGPALSSVNNLVSVAWFTGETNSKGVYMSLSHDGGINFSKPIKIDSGNSLGRVDIEISADSTVFVSWMEALQDKADIMLSVYKDGILKKTEKLGTTSSARSSGFPRMTLDDRTLMVAWRDMGKEPPEIKTSLISF